MNQQQNIRTNSSVLIPSIVASLVSTVISNPVEVAKLNMQYYPLACPYYPHQSYRQLMSCSCTKFSFQGSLASLKMAVPQALFSSVVFMQIYEPLRAKLINSWQVGSGTATVTASMIARFAVGTMGIPMQSLRIRLSNQVKSIKLNFCGYRITILRDIAYSGLFWSSLQTYRNAVTQGEYRSQQKSKDFTWKNFTVNLLPSFVFSALTAAITTPLDTYKTRIQSQGLKKYSIIKGIVEIYKKQGKIGLFSGVEWRVLKSGLHTALYMWVYEWMIQRVSLNDTQQSL